MAKTSKSRARWVIAAVVIGLLVIVGFGAWQMRAVADAADAADAGASLTQDPARYHGETRDAYLVAREHPDLLAQLDCYCGCEQNEGHKNLLDCFRTSHGATCDICMGEALTAGKMLAQGTPIAQIRDALRARYGHGG
jgi:Protein of unknown function with PCYCGC motif